MNELSCLPSIVTLTKHFGVPYQQFYDQIIVHILRELLSNKFQSENLDFFLSKEIPLIFTSSKREAPFHLSLYLVCRKKPHAAKFFQEMVSKWLIPGKLFSPSFSLVADFAFEEFKEVVCTLVEIQFPIQRELDYEVMMKNLEIISHEIKLGVTSSYHAHRVLEMRGLSANEKITLVQEEIAQLVERFPQRVDYDIFSLMQHCFVVSREEFRLIRESHHLARVIVSLYLLRKNLILRVEKEPQKRQISFFCKKALLYLPLGTKHVLSLFVGINFLRENEVFAKKHLMKAIQTFIPHSKPIEESYLEIQECDYSTHLFYLEIEKEDRDPFSLEEIYLLKKELPEHLKGRVEYLLRPIFMPRNEEEVMRNIIVLSHQLKYVKDLPQVIISFDEQTDKHLSFTVILVRVLDQYALELSSVIKKIDKSYEVLIERERKVGMIRNKYEKQAVVLRFKLPSLPFLREDDSLDLYLARKEVVNQLTEAFGEIRDFNGGMISKQSEAFLSLKKLLGSLAFQHKLLLENFFHSIYPIEARSILNPKILKNLFLMLLSASKKKQKKFAYTFESEEGYQLALIDFYEVGLKKNVIEAVNELGLLSRKLIQLHLQTVDGIFLGYIYLEYDEEKKKIFYNTLKEALDI